MQVVPNNFIKVDCNIKELFSKKIFWYPPPKKKQQKKEKKKEQNKTKQIKQTKTHN